jgi:molecular chaperone DnaK (HSP70)
MKNFIITYDIDNNKINDSIHFNIKFNNQDENISIEEVYALLFNHIKFLSEKYSKIEIVDMFVTVPNFFDYHQRNAIGR